MNKRNSGFSLIELIIVILILSIVSAIVILDPFSFFSYQSLEQVTEKLASDIQFVRNNNINKGSYKYTLIYNPSLKKYSICSENYNDTIQILDRISIIAFPDTITFDSNGISDIDNTDTIILSNNKKKSIINIFNNTGYITFRYE